MRLFGMPSPDVLKAADAAAFHSGNAYKAVIDNKALWDEATLEALASELPALLNDGGDMYLLLAECVANAAMHARAEHLVLYARRRGRVALLTFYQKPPLGEAAARRLAKARRGGLPDYWRDAPGGFGFPIVARLSRNVTLSHDRHKLHVWFRL